MKKLYCLLIMTGIMILPAAGQKDTVEVTYKVKDTLNKNLRLFESDELLKLSLRFNINAYKKERTDTVYQDAILTYHISSTDSISKQIKLRARGNLRKEYCDFPPIRLNFEKSKLANDEFLNVNKLKLVTHCKLGNEEYTLKEFLIYKLYNVLTDNSFKVRLAQINYINTGRQSKPVKQFAFIIEPLEALCRRTNSVEVKAPNITQKNIKPEIMDVMAIFNYMIGNTDWSVPIKHNIVVLSQGASARPDLGIILPYDFDYAGLIDADYAVPYEGLGIASVRERKYLGICRDKEIFINELKEFLEKKEALYKVIYDFPYLKEKSKKDMIIYLDGFFAGIDKRNTLAFKLLQDCLVF